MRILPQWLTRIAALSLSLLTSSFAQPLPGKADTATSGPKAVVLPSELTQYIAPINGTLTAVPYSQLSASGGQSTSIQIVQSPGNLRHIPKYLEIRQRYGGVYPYVVVKSRKPYVVISQDCDVLVIGLTEPKRAMVPRSPSLRLIPQSDGTAIATPVEREPVNVIYVQDRLDLAVQLPPGVPSDLLKRQDLYRYEGSTHEPTWEVNQVRSFIVSRNYLAQDEAGKPIDVFKVVLK